MKKIAGAAIALAAMTGSALAADIYLPPASSPAPPPPTPVFSWEGSYAGVYAGRWQTGSGFWLAGVTVGHNFVRGSLVYGIEGHVGAVLGINDFLIGLSGRVGTAVGSTDRVLLYAEGGAEFIGGAGPGLVFDAGGGVEFAITDSLSVFAEAKAVFGNGIGFMGPSFTGGLNWHF